VGLLVSKPDDPRGGEDGGRLFRLYVAGEGRQR
jgi:hypothetical protein